MDSPAGYWEDTSNMHNNLKYERCGSTTTGPSPRVCKEEQNVYRYCETNGGNLNFTTAATSEDDEYTYHKKKISRDPMSHRIIEKRRRDRMNNCLADLSRLIPADYLKKGRGRIEKTEIIEMAIKHMKYLQAHFCTHLGGETFASATSERRPSTPHSLTQQLSHSLTQQQECGEESLDSSTAELAKLRRLSNEHYRLGFHECLNETMHFLVEVEGYYAGDSLCVSLISHLHKHCDSIVNSDRLSSLNLPPTPFQSSSSSELHSSVSTSSPTSTSSTSKSGGLHPTDATTSLLDEHHPGGGGGGGGGGVTGGGLGAAGDGGGGSTSCCSEAGSQLRDILTSPNSNHSMTSRMQLGVDSPTPPNVANGSTSSHDSQSNSSSLYKFKNNIKQRFSAEHHQHPLSAPSLSERLHNVVTAVASTTSNCTNGEAMATSKDCRSTTSSTSSSSTGKRRHSVDTQQPGSDLDAPSPQQRPYIQPAASIPIFALHSAGSYYIPLTVDLEAITPFLGNISLETHPNLASLVLHPVTISVNFHPPKVIFNNNNNTMINHNNNGNDGSLVTINNHLNGNSGKISSTNGGWHGMPQLQPASINSFLPIPKWASCLPERS